MKPSAALEAHRDAIRALVHKYPAANPRVFGSVLRGGDKEGSDLDLVIDALPGATLFDLGGLQMELEELLGVKVDLLTSGGIAKRLRDRILAEAVPV